MGSGKNTCPLVEIGSSNFDTRGIKWDTGIPVDCRNCLSTALNTGEVVYERIIIHPTPVWVLDEGRDIEDYENGYYHEGIRVVDDGVREHHEEFGRERDLSGLGWCTNYDVKVFPCKN